MKTYRGGEKVGPGIYCSLRTGELVQSQTQGTVLKGESTTKYMRLPVLLVLALGPLVGLAFVVFLPVIGILGFTVFITQRLGRRIWPVARRASHRASPGVAEITSRLDKLREGKAIRFPETPEITTENGTK